MYMVRSIASSFGVILSSAVAGLLLCYALWHAFKLMRHPEWGPPLIVVPIALGFADCLPDSEFLRRSLVFAAILAGPFSIAGIVWRFNLRDRARATVRLEADTQLSHSNTIDVTGASGGHARYPAIAACICDNRSPNPAELKHVARRFRREALAARYPTPSFAEKRAALRAARAALEGRVSTNSAIS